MAIECLLADPRNKGRTVGKVRSLTDRINVTKAIAAAVLNVHSSELVHKNIRPESIILFGPDTSDLAGEQAKRHHFPCALGKPYLVGFEETRKDADPSILEAVPLWQRRIYLSPDRQHPDSTRIKNTMKHGVYSLEVVLPEIALWENFVDLENPYGAIVSKSQRSVGKTDTLAVDKGSSHSTRGQVSERNRRVSERPGK